MKEYKNVNLTLVSEDRDLGYHGYDMTDAEGVFIARVGATRNKIGRLTAQDKNYVGVDVTIRPYHHKGSAEPTRLDIWRIEEK